ncbi:hypothetical protein F4803DRAFT_71887 [Xylaria telfairii]|nr:hypothetical protein F4803DRAFT_71887 [Xylaria telfairii]
MDFFNHNYNVDQGFVGEFDASLLEGSLDNTIESASRLQDDQIFGDHSLLPPPANPLWMCTGFFDHTPWPVAHQPSISAGVPSSGETLGSGAFYASNSQTEQFPDNQFPITSWSDASYTAKNRIEMSLGYSYSAEPASVASSLSRSNHEVGYGSGQISNSVYQHPLSLENEHTAYQFDSLDQEQHFHTTQTPDTSASGASPPTLSITPLSPHECLLCPRRPKFSTPREYNRHQRTAKNHRSEGSRYYRCACGKTEIAGRRDNYRRHIESCKFARVNPYVCRCGKESTAQHEHKAHLRDCVHRRPYCPQLAV